MALPPKQLMAVPLATIRITYPEKLVIQIVKSAISQDNRRSIVFHKYDTAVGHRGPSSTTGPFLLKLVCAAPAAPAPPGWFAGPYQEGILDLCQLPILWELEWPSQGTCGEPVFSNWDKS